MIKNNLTDEELVQKVRGDDIELYSEIIKRYEGKLGHYLRKFVRDKDEVEDVLQEVFIKVYRNLNGFNIGKKFSSWVYRIAHNEAINHIKKAGNSKKVDLDEVEYKMMDESLNLDQKIDQSLLKMKMERILGMVKLKYREPLILYYFEQKSYEEISDILRMPKSTVGTLIRRGKEILKNNILQNFQFSSPNLQKSSKLTNYK